MTERAAVARRPDRLSAGTDPVLAEIVEYVHTDLILTETTLAAAATSFTDALACAFLALQHPECTRHLGPVVPGTVVPGGARVPGRPDVLDPVSAAHDIGCLVRWLDYNDTWLGREWGHPSDNLGAVLALGDFLSRRRRAAEDRPLLVADVLEAAVRAYEIQGVLALDTAVRDAGLDHVVLVRVASAAAAAGLLGADRVQTLAAVSHAWVDGGPLRLYRQWPAAGPRKSWAAAEATARGVALALLARSGEPPHPDALSAPGWGFQDAVLGGRPVQLLRPLGTYVVENVLYKVDYPAEFFAQAAAEAACSLASRVAHRLDDIVEVEVATTSAAMRLIDKPGPLRHPADRDHCLQYVVAAALLHGRLDDRSYDDAVAHDPRLESLRRRVRPHREERFDAAFEDPAQRAVPAAVTVRLRDGSVEGPVEVLYPIGHPARRVEARPRLARKLRDALGVAPLSPDRRARLAAVLGDLERLSRLPVDDLLGLMCPGGG